MHTRGTSLKVNPQREANSDEFLRCRARGTLTLDLVVMEFRSWCRQKDLASAYAVPLESSGPGFCGVEQGLGEQVEVWWYTGPEMLERNVKCWNSNSMGARGYVKGGLELTLLGPFNVEQGGSTPDLIVTEFRSECKQTDLASACVLRPLNHLVLDFEMGRLVG